MMRNYQFLQTLIALVLLGSSLPTISFGFDAYFVAQQTAAHAAQMQSSRNLAEEFQAFQNIDEAKAVLKQLLLTSDKCPVGSCINSHRLAICDFATLIKLRAANMLPPLKSLEKLKTTDFSLSADETVLLEKILQSCRLNPEQFWNYPMLTHVNFLPNAADDQWIRNYLGVNVNR